MNVKHLITLISDWIIILPLLLGAVFFKRIGAESKLILLVVVAGTIPQMIHCFYNGSSWQDFSFNFYSPVELLIYFFLFYGKLHLKALRVIFLLATILNLFTSLLFITDYNWFQHFINEWTLINNISYLVWIGLVITQAFITDADTLTMGQPFFWFLIGILVYATCTTVVYSLWQKIKESPEVSVLRYLWNIQNFFNIVLYILFAKGIWVDAKQYQPKPATLLY